MALVAGILGLPNAGKTTLFNALTRAGAEITAYETTVDKPNVGMAPIRDERLTGLATLESSKKITPATLRVVDVAGTGPAMLGNLRKADALLGVVDGFSPLADVAAAEELLRLEILVADRDHVDRRLVKVRSDAKSGDREVRAELERLEVTLAHVESGESLSSLPCELPAELEPLTTKPLIVLVNGPQGIDAKLEAELSELPENEAAAFRDGSDSALDDILRRLFDELDLLTFFTGGDTEARGWTLSRGQTALDAAATIHTDIARGFIRCEVIPWSDLESLGSRAEAARQGVQRLEGRDYVVVDGDVLNIRFNI